MKLARSQQENTERPLVCTGRLLQPERNNRVSLLSAFYNYIVMIDVMEYYLYFPISNLFDILFKVVTFKHLLLSKGIICSPLHSGAMLMLVNIHILTF